MAMTLTRSNPGDGSGDLRLPGNLGDRSRIYGFGRAEDRIGAVTRERGGLLKSLALSTKLDRDMETGRFQSDRARRSTDEIRTAPGVDKFQALHLHDPCLQPTS